MHNFASRIFALKMGSELSWVSLKFALLKIFGGANGQE
jgi:hypothetical protein